MSYIYKVARALFGRLLQENGDFLLLETGDKILIGEIDYTYKSENAFV